MKKVVLLCVLFAGLNWAAYAGLPEVAPLVPRAITEGNVPPGIDDITDDMIAYDSQPTVTWPSLIEPGTFWAVRFTPVQACSLTYLQVVTVDGAGPGRIHVWSDDGNGFPDADLITPFEVTLLGNVSYQEIELPAPIDIGNNDFHAGVEYLRNPPPFVTGDADGGTENRSKYKEPSAEDWIVLVNNDLNIRAFVRYYGDDQVPPQIAHIPISMGFDTQDSYLVEATITDDSGVESAYVYYSTDGGSTWLDIMMSNDGDDYSAEIPEQGIGTEVWYYIEATDNSSNHNVGNHGTSEDPHVFQVVEGSEIAYDDGQAEAFFIVNDAWDNNSLAVLMTPGNYPATVTILRAYVNGAETFSFTVNAESNGLPGSILAGPYDVNGDTVASWVNFEIPEEDRPIIQANQNFFVLLNWQESSPENPEVGGDQSQPDGRSWWRFGNDWDVYPSGDWMIRSVGIWPTGVEHEMGGLPVSFELNQNYPNPFNAETIFSYSLREPGEVTLEVFNLEGRRINTLVKGYQQAGLQQVTWDGTNAAGQAVSSGVYLYRLSANGKSATRAMVLLK